MSTTPKKRKRRRSRKKLNLQPVFLGLAVVCVMVGGIWLLHYALQNLPEQSQPTAATLAPLPPNVYGPEDFSYDQRGYLRCTAGEYRLGIDVSDHQGDIDWQQVADAGIEFAFVRVGYRGYSEGIIYSDDHADYNLTQAKAAGVQVGAYFYSQAVNEEEAAQEAAYCLNVLKDYEIDLPVVFDWEYVSTEARTGAMDRDTLTRCAKTFCQAVEDAGYRAMIYANPDIARNLMDLRALQDYPFWLAMYSDTMNYSGHMDYWQYTSTGTVPGIEGNVDIDLMFIYD